jgi:hypothetical protein
MGGNFDPGRQGRILRLNGRRGRAALAHVGRYELGIDARGVDDG